MPLRTTSSHRVDQGQVYTKRPNWLSSEEHCRLDVIFFTRSHLSGLTAMDIILHTVSFAKGLFTPSVPPSLVIYLGLPHAWLPFLLWFSLPHMSNSSHAYIFPVCLFPYIHAFTHFIHHSRHYSHLLFVLTVRFPRSLMFHQISTTHLRTRHSHVCTISSPSLSCHTLPYCMTARALCARRHRRQGSTDSPCTSSVPLCPATYVPHIHAGPRGCV